MPAHCLATHPLPRRRHRLLRFPGVIALTTCLLIGKALATPPPTDTAQRPSPHAQALAPTAAPAVTSGIVHHLVLARLKPEIDKVRAQDIREASVKLLKDIPGVLDVTTGIKLRDDRPVHLRDYDMVIHVRLDSAASLDGYAGHPLHKEFLARHGASIARYQVLDYVESP